MATILATLVLIAQTSNITFPLYKTTDDYTLYIKAFVGSQEAPVNLRVTTFNKLVSVISPFCSIKCSVPNKFDVQKSSTYETVAQISDVYDHFYYDSFHT